MECVLDSGEVQTLHRGDLCIQRATKHAWRNVTENNGWARMMFVLQVGSSFFFHRSGCFEGIER